MADLSQLSPDHISPPDVLAVWRECWRVLKPGGVLLAGFMNPGLRSILN